VYVPYARFYLGRWISAGKVGKRCSAQRQRRGRRRAQPTWVERTKRHHTDEAHVLELLHGHLGGATEELALRRAALRDAMTPHTTRWVSSTPLRLRLP
jgi:hypothetical protein